MVKYPFGYGDMVIDSYSGSVKAIYLWVKTVRTDSLLP